MKLSEVNSFLVSQSASNKVSYRAFPETIAPNCPFFVWEIVDENYFYAGDAVILPVDRIQIHRITKAIDTAGEATFEAALEALGQAWRKAEPEYLSDEKVYIRTYEFEVIE